MKTLKLVAFLMTCTLLFNTQCEEDNDGIIMPDITNCDESAMIDNELYENGATDFFSIENITIEGDCLSAEYGASGCNSNSWILTLVDSGAVAESLPPQRSLKFLLNNSSFAPIIH